MRTKSLILLQVRSARAGETSKRIAGEFKAKSFPFPPSNRIASVIKLYQYYVCLPESVKILIHKSI